ncbi:hypothetical protein L6164_019166 [Bauhinia variegata]|uniref:Uncharacterized protein n=1 Tax=Bauhinia variegata TaxID=167791 RepID=A0ACB9NE85_BAUVA|nr:hypothetical protein L6164_019166 [Bauhinia variegata]
MKGMDLFCSSSASTAVICSSVRGGPKTCPHDPSKSQLPRVPCSSHLPINPKPHFEKHRKSLAEKQNVNATNLHRRSSAQVDDLYNSPTRHLLSVEPAPFVDWISESDRVSLQSRVFIKDNSPALRPSCSARSRNQVVVLRVSLHCKGCESKVRKHISKMEGVTSFSIDLESKKVTIIGDVTPLGVLASISKVKNAQLWPSSPWST